MALASSVASPLCTWIVAACMTVGSERANSNKFLQCPKKTRRSSRRKNLVSSFYCSGMNSLMNFCPFEPCQQYYNSQRLSSSFALFGESGFSLFGSKAASMNRKERRVIKDSHSGKTEPIAIEPIKPVTTKMKLVTKKRRVVVTGLGVVSPLGHNPDIFYGNLLEGISGVSQIEAFDCTEFPSRIAGEIKNFSADGWVSRKLSKRADKFMLYLLTAGKKALIDGGITGEVDKAKCGIIIGSSLGGMKVCSDSIEALRVSHRKMNPFCVPFAMTNMGSAILAIDLGWMGPNYSISAACATSNFCILSAANHIIRGDTDIMLCGGSDSAIVPIGLGGFAACGVLSQRNDDPTKASRPWDMHGDGFILGEGAGVLLLEELDHAKRRGAAIYAEFLGGSYSCDAYHLTDPHPCGSGSILCIEKALADSGVAREDVNYINAHATSTTLADVKEYQAIVHCFGQNTKLRVNSTKSMIGHLLGAAGAVEAIATVKAIETGWIHPNLNLEQPNEAVDANILVGPKKEPLDIKVALSNSLGFGGHNSSIVFAPYKDDNFDESCTNDPSG